MQTLIADRQTDYFWELVAKQGLQVYFQESCPADLVEIIIVRTVTTVDKYYLNSFPNLKLIIRAGSGTDNIDVVTAAAKGIVVCNTPEANALSACEHTLAFVYAMIKQHQISKTNILQGRWKDGMDWNVEIGDLNVMVVGVGRIGTKVARTLKYLGAKVVGVDPYLSQEEWAEKGIDPVTYEEGLRDADLITFHCPLTEETLGYFSSETLDKLSKPIYLVNTARGQIVDEEAVGKGLRNGLIKAAAFDVFAKEPHPKLAYADADNVYLTPHSGAFTVSAKKRLAEEILSVWKSFVFQKAIINEVTI